jgi:RNA polymerase sigma-70 factor (ECF subfamily)
MKRNSQMSRGKEVQVFEKLYRENFDLLCKKAFRFVQDRDVAKDIVQDAFLALWKNDAHIISAEAYLYRSVINKSINCLNQQRRTVPIMTLEYIGKDDASPDNLLQWEELQLRVKNAIDALPDAAKKVFFLSRLEGLSYREIAELLEISVNTVEKHMGRALKDLRQAVR